MSKNKYNDYRPEIVGMEWTPGNLILVASRSWGGKNQYVLGNCIVAGTKDEITVAYFLPDGDSIRIRRALLRMQVGPQVYDSGQIKTENIKELPLFFDDTPDMTIAYIVDRLFHLAETKGIGMAVIDGLQDINSDQGRQYTCQDWKETCAEHPEMRISMDGRGRAKDNIWIERFWRTI